MISRDHKAIFIHVPKCAGSSVEKLLGARPFDYRIYNPNFVTGWHPSLKRHSQHLTAKEMKKLVGHETWYSCFRFAFVRNPYRRALSGYRWLMETSNIVGSFMDYLKASGPFSEILGSAETMESRAVHLQPQSDFINEELDFIGRVENFDADMLRVCHYIRAPFYPIRENRSSASQIEHSMLDREIDLINDLYLDDFRRFGYDML